MTFREWLVARDACPEAIDWVGSRTVTQAWAECPRADWLVWLAGRHGAAQPQLVLCAAACAESVAHMASDDSACAVAWAIDAARRWVRGEADPEECDAAYAAAAYAAGRAARAAAYAAYAAADAYAAYAHATAAAVATAADIVREHLPCPTIVGVA